MFLTHQQFKSRVKEARNDALKILSTYKGCEVKVKVQCKKCDKVWKSVPAVLFRPVPWEGCYNCITRKIKNYNPKSGRQSLTNSEYKRRVRDIHGRGIKPVETYVSSHIKIKHTCDKGHDWKATPTSIIHQKTGCPICKEGKSYSSLAIAWIDGQAKKNRIRIKHMENGGEYKIPSTVFKVDGFHPRSKTIYEFYGDRYHGNPKKFSARDKCHPFDKKVTAGRLYKDTIKREKTLKSLGYNIVAIWESDYIESLSST